MYWCQCIGVNYGEIIVKDYRENTGHKVIDG